MSVLVQEGPDSGLVWHTGDPFGEQQTALDGHGVAALPNREVVTVKGLDRLNWLGSLTSNRVDGLAPGESVTTLALDNQGHPQYVLQGVDDGESFWCWTEPGLGDRLADYLASMRFLLRVEVERRPDVQVAWLGASEPLPDRALAVRDSELAGGREVFLPADAALPPGVVIGTWALEALRVAAGIPRLGLDTDEQTIPNELGLYATATNKGCYTGQETVGRVNALGRPPRRLIRLLFDGDLPASGEAIELGGKEVGFVGTVAQHHELGPIGLGIVKRSVPVDAQLLAGGIDASQEVLVDPEIGEHFRPRFPRQ